MKQIHEYNPRKLPPINPREIESDSRGRANVSENCFYPAFIEIDGEMYSVDVGSLPHGGIEENPDFTLGELLSS